MKTKHISLGDQGMRQGVMSSLLMPSPRQVLFVGGLMYLAVGYLSGSCLRMVVASVALLLPAIIWDVALWVSRQFGLLPNILRKGILVVSTMIYYFSTTAMPARALFLDKLCGLMLSVVEIEGATTTGGAVTISTLIVATINIIRALFILYLAIALIGVFNQMQRDEEWQVAARTPLLAVVIVGIIEGISHLIAPTGVAQCSAG